MNSDVSLALMTKATAVFAREGQFLSFPLTPMVWQAARLGFQGGALSAADAVNAMSEFSRLANVIPAGVMYPPTEQSVIWDVLHDVFASAVLARSIRTAPEEASYQAAVAELYTTRPDGLRDPTPKYQAYRQWEDAWNTAKQAITQRAMEAQSSSDPAMKQAWARDEPAMDAHLNDVMAQWQAAGFKDEIEHAQRVVGDLGAKSPDQTWSGWRSQFGEGVNSLTDPAGETFFPPGSRPPMRCAMAPGSNSPWPAPKLPVSSPPLRPSCARASTRRSKSMSIGSASSIPRCRSRGRGIQGIWSRSGSGSCRRPNGH